MKPASALLSVSLVLLLSPTATAVAPRDSSLVELASWLGEETRAVDSLLETMESRARGPTVCVWFEPGVQVGTIVVDINHYIIQVPVPAVDPEAVASGGHPAGTYFIQLSFSGAGCSG